MAYNPLGRNFGTYSIWNPPPNPGAPPSVAGDVGLDVNPLPQPGQGAFGLVPGPTGVPPSRYQQVQGLYNRLQPAGEQDLENIIREIGGEVDEPTLLNDAAAFGVSSGMPGSPFANIRGLNRTLQERQAMRRQGGTDLLSFLTGVGSTMTDPALAARISQENAQLRAAPDPYQAFLAQRNLYDRYRNQSPAGGTGKYDDQMKALDEELKAIRASIGQPGGGTIAPGRGYQGPGGPNTPGHPGYGPQGGQSGQEDSIYNYSDLLPGEYFDDQGNPLSPGRTPGSWDNIQPLPMPDLPYTNEEDYYGGY